LLVYDPNYDFLRRLIRWQFNFPNKFTEKFKNFRALLQIKKTSDFSIARMLASPNDKLI